MSTWHDWGMPLSGKDLVQHEKFLPNKERVSISLPESPKPCKQNYKEAHFCNQRVCKGAVNVLTHKAVVVLLNTQFVSLWPERQHCLCTRYGNVH